MNKRARNKSSVGARIIQRLDAFKAALRKGEDIAGRFTYRQVILDLEPICYGPAQIRETRKLLNISQALFSKFLGVSVSTVRAWEHGTNVPSPMACRFIDEIRRDPAHWIRRLKSAMVCRQVQC
jgi:putative transcriptional regulator